MGQPYCRRNRNRPTFQIDDGDGGSINDKVVLTHTGNDKQHKGTKEREGEKARVDRTAGTALHITALLSCGGLSSQDGVPCSMYGGLCSMGGGPYSMREREKHGWTAML